MAEDDGRLTGIEVPEVADVTELRERAEDRKVWIQEGQTFQGAFYLRRKRKL